VIRCVEVKVKVTEQEEFASACGVVFKERVKVREEHGVGEFVFGAGRGTIQTGEDDGLAG
jgi:hypothetical protein